MSFVTIYLDTTKPANPTITIAGGQAFATAQLVNIALNTDDTDKTGYEMLIWGDVDPAYDTKVQATEGASQWQAYQANPQIKLKAITNVNGDPETKTINIRIRDDVRNPSDVVFDTISLDTSIPTVLIVQGLDVTKISRQAQKDTASFQFSCNQSYVAFKVKLVGGTGATESQGTPIPTAGGSTGVTGSGTFTSATVNTVTLKTADLETAGANINGANIIKVFVQEQAGTWSV